jgi:hypothetical protein
MLSLTKISGSVPRILRKAQRLPPVHFPIVQRAPGSEPKCPCGGGCPSCSVKAGLQPKFATSEPGDPLEREADRLADNVLRVRGVNVRPQAHSAPIRRLSDMREQHGDKGLKAERDAEAISGIPRIVHEVLRSPGEPLDAQTRAFMEPRFGADFGDIRVHTDAKAAQSARAIHADAYTVGADIVFGTGRFSPGSEPGQRLVAHELAHTLQQHRGASGMVMRRWDQASECADAPTDSWIEKVVVDQETPQTVTVHWSDGTSESDACSTGKGHCCVDPAEPSGAACTISGSYADGSNCTPITVQNGYLVKNRVRDHNGVEFWTEFVPDRAIALHKYSPVDGTPLSHGCVRLHEDMASKIFCNVRQNKTWVQIHGFARPKCDHAGLQDEWRGDFSMGGADLSKADGETQTQILETRKELNAAFGRKLSVMEIQALTIDDIPRCTRKAPLPKAAGP